MAKRRIPMPPPSKVRPGKRRDDVIDWQEEETFCPLCGVPKETHQGVPGSCFGRSLSLPRKRP